MVSADLIMQRQLNKDSLLTAGGALTRRDDLAYRREVLGRVRVDLSRVRGPTEWFPVERRQTLGVTVNR